MMFFFGLKYVWSFRTTSSYLSFGESTSVLPPSLPFAGYSPATCMHLALAVPQHATTHIAFDHHPLEGERVVVLLDVSIPLLSAVWVFKYCARATGNF